MEYENFIENFGSILNTIVYSQATGHKQPTSSLNTLFHRKPIHKKPRTKVEIYFRKLSLYTFTSYKKYLELSNCT